MSALDLYLTEVRPWAPGVPDPVAYKAIRSAAIEFCERTRLWKYEDDYDVTAEDCGEIFTPNGSVLHDVEIMMFDGRPLLPKTSRDLDAIMPRWRLGIDQTSGLSLYFTQIEQNSFRIVPANDGHINLCLRLKPSPTTMELPDFLANEYKEIIGWGALGRLLTTPGQSYSSPDLATYYRGLFIEKIDRLSTKGTTGQQNAPKRSRSRFF